MANLVQTDIGMHHSAKNLIFGLMRIGVGCLVAIFFGLLACRPAAFTPKPCGYFKLDTPSEHKYKLFDKPGFPYTFEMPVYGDAQEDTADSHGKHDETRFWLNIYLPKFNGVINITYKDVTPKQTLDQLVAASYEMSFFHHEKAAFIDHTEFFSPQGNDCVVYTVGGNVATRYQFTATDSTKHFIRGALYFDVTPNADSLKPASDFIQQDILHILNTLKWR